MNATRNFRSNVPGESRDDRGLLRSAHDGRGWSDPPSTGKASRFHVGWGGGDGKRH